jgi:TM2 domain-containing membrane protein YozV
MKLKAYLVFFIGWFIPGAGHLILKRYIRAGIFFVSVSLMFIVGILLNGKFFESINNPLAILAYLGNIGNGLFFLIAKFGKLLNVDYSSITYEYGTAYLATSGFLNFMIALNAYDIASGKKK